MPGTIWIDVEDLFEYARYNRRPSGIQRLEYELSQALAQSRGGVQVRFLRHDPAFRAFYTVAWASVERLFRDLASGPAPQPAAPPPSPAALTSGPAALERLPASIHAPLARGLRLQRDAALALAEAARAGLTGAARRTARRFRPPPPPPPPAPPMRQAGEDGDIDELTQPGDVLLVLGTPWFNPDYAATIAAAKARGLRFALLIYDLIPLRRPEWCQEALVQVFTTWLKTVLPQADVILTISRASATDLQRHFAEAGLALGRPRVIPVGTGFGSQEAPAAAPGRALPDAGSYVLVVSTIEIRKNHALLFRIWRRLLDSMPAARVPTLVFAGRLGWLVADLVAQLENSGFLGGKILLIEDPTDAELERLYRGCRFTIFPSFYEGWGLPVTESLAFGRPCIISNATSLPEAGATLARYFDPEDGQAAYAMIRHMIESPEEVADWQRRIAREFRPVSWHDSATALLAALRPADPAQTASHAAVQAMEPGGRIARRAIRSG